MSFKIIVANRLIKVCGSVVKLLSYAFHGVFPQVRFTIPVQSSPIWESATETAIPRIVWQTNFTNKVALPVYINYLFNRMMAPQYEFRHVSHEERLLFMEEYATDEVKQAYIQLTDGAAQADLWRVVVLHTCGGVYMDIDGHVVWPLASILKDDARELILLNKEHYTNYFIASAKHNPILEKTIAIIVDNIQQKNVEKGVYNLTGPATLNLAIGYTPVNHRFYRITCVQGSFTNEHFQYIDKPRGKWTYAKSSELLKK